MKKYTGPVIDAHVHLVEELGRGFGPHGDCFNLGNGKIRWADGFEQQIFAEGVERMTPEDCLAILDENNIESAVLMQGGLLGLNNEYSVNAMKKYPGRYYAMGSFDPYANQAEKIMHRLIDELGVIGLKFEISCMYGVCGYHDDFRINSDRMQKVYQYLSEKDLPVSFDMCSFGEYCLQIDECAEIAAKYPNLKIIQEHLFMPNSLERIPDMVKALEVLKPFENVWFSTACIPLNMHEFDYPYPKTAKAVAAAAEVVGHKRLIWGTDLPQGLNGSTYAKTRDYLEDSGTFSADELADVMYNNAKKFYKI